jgi:hypothetical protein
MDLKTNSDDLRILIDSKIAALTDFDDDLRGYTSKLLLASAGRTFLWVSIVLKKLKATTLASRAIVEKIVAESPTDLDQLYNSIIWPNHERQPARTENLGMGGLRPAAFESDGTRGGSRNTDR